MKASIMGVVPSKQGYSVRVAPLYRTAVIHALKSEKAEQKGRALGIEKRTAWEIQGAPPYANATELISLLADPIGEWKGWLADPRKPLTPFNGKPRTWVVDSAGPPPSNIFITDTGDMMVISRRKEPKTHTNKTSPFAKIGQMGDIPTARDLFSEEDTFEDEPGDFLMYEDNAASHQQGLNTICTSNDTTSGDHADAAQVNHTAQASPPQGVRAVSPWVTPKASSAALHVPNSVPTVHAPPTPIPMQIDEDPRDAIIRQLRDLVASLEAKISGLEASLSTIANAMAMEAATKAATADTVTNASSNGEKGDAANGAVRATPNGEKRSTPY